MNIEQIIFDSEIKEEIELDLTVTEELKEKGDKRKIIRIAREARKELGLKPNFIVGLSGTSMTVSSDVKEELRIETVAKEFIISDPPENVDIVKDVKIDEKIYKVFIRKK